MHNKTVVWCVCVKEQEKKHRKKRDDKGKWKHTTTCHDDRDVNTHKRKTGSKVDDVGPLLPRELF